MQKLVLSYFTIPAALYREEIMHKDANAISALWNLQFQYQFFNKLFHFHFDFDILKNI